MARHVPNRIAAQAPCLVDMHFANIVSEQVGMQLTCEHRRPFSLIRYHPMLAFGSSTMALWWI